MIAPQECPTIGCPYEKTLTLEEINEQGLLQMCPVCGMRLDMVLLKPIAPADGQA